MPPSPHHLNRALLLLPPAPSPPDYAALEAAYNTPLLTVLRELARSSRPAQEPAVLDVALPCPHLYGRLQGPRSPFYAPTQQLVAHLYKLICVIATKQAIDTEDADGVDARVVLLAYPRDGRLTLPSEDASPEQEAQGPAIDLHTLARSSRAWDAVYSVESEEGEALLNNFLAFSPSGRNTMRLRGGLVAVEMSSAATTARPESTTAVTEHRSVAVGGTFDHLHIGHKLLLTMFAFVLSRPSSSDDGDARTLTIGITGDALLKNKKHAEYLESWPRRQQMVQKFMSSIVDFGQHDDRRIHVQEFSNPGPNGHAVHVSYPFNLVVKYVEIWDPFGPTITDEAISALAISLETRSGGAAVNQKRAERGWAPLDVFEVAVLDAGEEESVDETFQSKLSSTEIRRKRSEQAAPSQAA